MLSLPELLRARAAKSLRYILREADGVMPEYAFCGRAAIWPDQPYGICQDGSIAGIIGHVAAWKQMTLPMFTPAGAPIPRTAFRIADHADMDDWGSILAWLHHVGAEWQAALTNMADTDFGTIRSWEGSEIIVHDFVYEMLMHDAQHAAQIEYLRVLYSVQER